MIRKRNSLTRRLAYGNLFSWVSIASIACGTTVSLESEYPSQGPGAFESAGSSTPPSPIQLSGRWKGTGEVFPANLYSINYHSEHHFPRDYKTPCVVELEARQTADSFEIVSLHIRMPDLSGYEWFNAYVTDRNTNTTFDPMKFLLKGDPKELLLYPIRRDGSVSNGPHYGSRISESAQKVVISNFSTPYGGAYRDGNINAYTSSVSLTLDQQAKDVFVGKVEFWSYGSSVGHATDASCDGFTLRKQ